MGAGVTTGRRGMGVQFIVAHRAVHWRHQEGALREMGGVAAGAQDLELFSGKLPHACLPAWRALAAATVQISPPPSPLPPWPRFQWGDDRGYPNLHGARWLSPKHRAALMDLAAVAAMPDGIQAMVSSTLTRA